MLLGFPKSFETSSRLEQTCYVLMLDVISRSDRASSSLARVACFLLMTVFITAQDAVPQESGTATGEDSSIEALDASLRQVRESAEFKATFQWNHGTLDSWPERVDLVDAKALREVATGVYVTLRGHERQDIVYTRELISEEVEMPGRAGQPVNMIHNLSSVEMRGPNLHFRYVPEQQQVSGNATLGDMSSETGDHCTGSFLEMSPLNPMMGCFKNFPGEPNPPFALDDYAIEIVGEARVSLKAVRNVDASPPYSIEHSLVWRTDFDIPVIERVASVVTYEDESKPPIRMECWLSDFRKCNNVMIASGILLLSNDAFKIKDGERVPLVRVREWRSSDLGNVPPIVDDFTIELPAHVMLGGLRNVAASGQVRTIRFLDLTPEDLGTSVMQSVPPSAASDLPPAGKRGSWRLAAFLFGNVVLVIFVALFWFRSKKRDRVA